MYEKNRLTPIREIGKRGNSVYWEMRCSCGVVKQIAMHNYVKGATRSCGCLRDELAKKRIKHGMTGSSTYVSWQAMLARCRHKNEWYGGRGISVCARWSNPKTGFENFLKDMGERPKNHTIERRDPNGNYCPDNCFWLHKSKQSQNTRANVKLTFRGKTQCIAAWARELGIAVRTLNNRIAAGWSVPRALCETVKPGRRHRI